MIMWMGLLFTWLSASFLFIGCVTIEKSYPDKRYFVLDIALDTSPQNPAETGTLQISSARVSPRYADKNFVYRRSDARFESFSQRARSLPTAMLPVPPRSTFSHAVRPLNEPLSASPGPATPLR